MFSLINKSLGYMGYALRKRRFLRTYKKFREFTMIGPATYVCNLELIASSQLGSGAVVECGTWKGGMIAGIADYLGAGRQYYLFDSFEGLPPANEVDGKAARDWQADTSSPHYRDNCRASERDAHAAMSLAGISDSVIQKGWFQETLPAYKFAEGIALLRLDADWYDSTLEVLVNFYPQVNAGGLIIVDDYYTWDGCSKALHHFLSSSAAVERISAYKGICFLIKR